MFSFVGGELVVEFVGGLVWQGLLVISGLVVGVDVWVYVVVLDQFGGCIVVVVVIGLDWIYLL